MTGVSTCQLIVDPPASGPWNMAVDEALLAAADDNGQATLRLYQWSEPTLSLGYFQPYKDRQQHTASRERAVVRRASGGGAILHDRELTYSLVLPTRHPLAQDGKGLYICVHQALAGSLTTLLSRHGPGWSLRLVEGVGERTEGGEPFLCFERRTSGDILLAQTAGSSDGSATDNAWKIVGSAQRRRRGAILQHGSVLLARSPAAPELPGLRDLTDLAVTPERLLADLPAALGQAIGVDLRQSPLPAELLPEVQRLAQTKYGSQAWTERR